MKEAYSRSGYIFYFALSLILLSGCVSTIPKYCSDDFNDNKNLVVNGDFECNSPSNWVIISNQQTISHLDVSNSHQGNQCFQISSMGSGTDLISDFFKINPSEVFYCQGMFKSREQSEVKLKFSLVAFDKKGRIVNSFHIEDFIEKEWTMLEFTSGFFSTSARYARIVISIPVGYHNSLWVDDIKCYSAYDFMQ